jgi:hypothetical protein
VSNSSSPVYKGYAIIENELFKDTPLLSVRRT